MTEAEQQGLADGRALRFLIPRRALRGGPGSVAAPRAGESLEFQDYRDYTPGDDLRNLDWNVLARSDREVVKVHREEVAPVIEMFQLPAGGSPSSDRASSTCSRPYFSTLNACSSAPSSR